MFLYKQVYLKERVEVRNSFKAIYGLGFFKSNLISIKLGLGYPYSIDNLNFYLYNLLVSILNEFTWLEVRIKHVIINNIKRLININCYKGTRHRDSLPCRGQRTRTNAKSCKRYKIL
jgi:small subunit ribosomal protein S13